MRYELSTHDSFSVFPALHTARKRSWRTLAAIAERLSDDALPPEITTIAVAGSLGRLEQTAHSDVDLIVVTNGHSDGDPEVMDHVWDRLTPLGLGRPKAEGIFARPLTRDQLFDPSTLGVIDEEMAVFGVRMQLLLEGRAVFGEPQLQSLWRGIVARFIEPKCTGPNLWRALLDDLLRYHRSLCARYRFIERSDPAQAAELQLKAGYSRLINVAGLLFLLGESLNSPDPVEWLHARLQWTPLERIANIAECHDQEFTSGVLGRYDRFLAALQDDDFRRELAAGANSARLRELHESAGELKRAVVGFLLDRTGRGAWPAAFLEQLLL